MATQSDGAVRGREVVWTAGSLDAAGDRDRARRLLGRIAALTAVSVLAAGLLVVVATWSIISPVGTSPTTPLWIAPADVDAPRSTPSAAPSHPQAASRRTSAAADRSGSPASRVSTSATATRQQPARRAARVGGGDRVDGDRGDGHGPDDRHELGRSSNSGRSSSKGSTSGGGDDDHSTTLSTSGASGTSDPK